MRNVSVAGQFSRRPRLIGSFFGDFGDPGEAGQRWQPPVPFEQSTGSRDRTPASGVVRRMPCPAPSAGTGLGASASFTPHGAASRRYQSQDPGNRVAMDGPRLLQPAHRRLTGKVNMATTERDILEGKVLPELQAIASSMGVQGYQRLRKADLIGAIIAKAQGVEFVPSSTPARGRRGGTTSEAQAPEGEAPAPEAGAAPAAPDQPELPGAGTVETSPNGPERRTRRPRPRRHPTSRNSPAPSRSTPHPPARPRPTTAPSAGPAAGPAARPAPTRPTRPAPVTPPRRRWRCPATAASRPAPAPRRPR